MTWIEYIKAVKGHLAGEVVETEDATADILCDAEVAKKRAAPAEVTTAATELKGTLAEFVKTAVADGFSELRKSFPAQKLMPHNVADGGDVEAPKIPAEVKKWSSLRNFTGADADQKAYRFGMFLLGTYAMDRSNAEHKCHFAVKRCKDLGINLAPGFLDGVDAKAAHNEGNNSLGGFLVPDEFQNEMIDLREKFGVFRQNAKIVPMRSDTRSDPRRKSGLTAYFVGEDIAGTQSQKSWDRVRLTAKKLMVLTKYSNELGEDAVLNVGDDLAGEISYQFAAKEDQCGFNGDGTSTYGGIVGVRQSLLNVDATIANILGLKVATGSGYASSYGSITLGDMNGVVGLLPEYADVPGETKWFCSKFFWGSVMQRLGAAAGGNTISSIEGGAAQKMFLGYPVVVSQVLPKTPAINQVVCLLGNLRMAASLGNRRDTSISISEHALNAFEQDEVVIRGTERFDINVHDVGESSAGTARDTTNGLMAGPIVGLVTSAS